jgi:DNA-binding NarL/FixJ family response regulator
MPANIAAIVILSSAGRLRDSLRVLLKSTRPLIPIEPAEGLEPARPRLAGAAPVLVLIDATLPEGAAWAALEEIRRLYPQHRCVILAQTAADQAQGRAAGVPVVGPESLTAMSLLATAEARNKV